MNSSIHLLIQNKWEGELCPIIDGILFDTGDIIIMECLTLTGDGNIEFKIHPLVRATLSSYIEFNPDRWTSIIELAAVTWEAGGLRASCGEGGYGSDGFVAVCQLEDNYLKWIAFFQSSNPFDKIDIVGADVVAVSTYGHVWTFPIQHPEQVKVRSGWGENSLNRDVMAD